MSYIGNSPRFTDTPVLQVQATSGQTAFSLSWTPASANALMVFVNGVQQRPNVDFTLSGSTLTFSTGITLNYYVTVFGIGVMGIVNTVSSGSIDSSKLAINSVGTTNIIDANVTPAKLSTGAPTWTSGGAVTMTGDITVSSTGAVQVSSGTTAQRPTAGNGKIRYNSDLLSYEGSDGTTWKPLGMSSGKAFYFGGF